MAGGWYQCPVCGLDVIIDTARPGYRCVKCGTPMQLDRKPDRGGRGARTTAAGTPEPGRGAQAEISGTGVPSPQKDARGRISSTNAKIDAPTLERLAGIVADAHTWPELMLLLDKSGVPHAGSRRTPKQKFLYGALERLNRVGGRDALAGVLEAACGSHDDERGTRGRINESLAPYGLMIDKGGRQVHLGRPRRPSEADVQAFDRWRYHRLVAECAKAKFLKGEYHGAVSECCKALETMIQKKSGLADSGVGLMSRAFGDERILVAVLPGLGGDTRDSVQRGLMYLCMGIMSGVRNPVSHEPEGRFPIGRTDALDILGTISYLCKQVDRTRRTAKRTPPKTGTKRGPKTPAGRGAGASRPAAGSGGGRPVPRANRAGEEAVELAVSPGIVVRGGTVGVTIVGREIGDWRVDVRSGGGAVVLGSKRLDALCRPESAGGGRSRHLFFLKTPGYAPGEYVVSVSKGGRAHGKAHSRKFTVASSRHVRGAARTRNSLFGEGRPRRVVR